MQPKGKCPLARPTFVSCGAAAVQSQFGRVPLGNSYELMNWSARCFQFGPQRWRQCFKHRLVETGMRSIPAGAPGAASENWHKVWQDLQLGVVKRSGAAQLLSQVSTASSMTSRCVVSSTKATLKQASLIDTVGCQKDPPCCTTRRFGSIGCNFPGLRHSYQFQLLVGSLLKLRSRFNKGSPSPMLLDPLLLAQQYPASIPAAAFD